MKEEVEINIFDAWLEENVSVWFSQTDPQYEDWSRVVFEEEGCVA